MAWQNKITMKVAFYPKRLADQIISIDSVPVKGTPTVSVYPNINGNYFFAFFKNDHNPVLSTDAESSEIKMVLFDIVKKTQYTIISQGFVGGHPPHAPHYTVS